MKTSIIIITCILLVITSLTLYARPNNVPLGKILYDANCASCHGADAKAHGKNIGGKSRADMYAILVNMRNMADEGTVVSPLVQKMLDVLGGLNNEEIHAIADYTATLK